MDSTNYVETKPDTQVVTDLLAMRTLLSDPARWCRGLVAKTARGCLVEPWDQRAEQFCLQGAMARVTGLTSRADIGERHRIVSDALSQTAGMKDAHFNDSHTHAAVLDLIDRTVARLRQP